MRGLRASLIISTWNGRHLLETCLPRVLRAVEAAGGDHEVIVVDDASRDDTAEFVRRAFPGVRLIRLARNLRFAGANNAAARAALGDVLVFLNNDMLVEPGFLEPLLSHFADPAVFAATAYIQMPGQGAQTHRVRETGLVRARFEDGFFALRHEEPTSDQPVAVLYAGGGSSAYRRDYFLRLGGFDRLFRPFYFEDLDVTYRAQKVGWRVLFEPRSRVLHKHRQTNNPRNFPGPYIERMFQKNSLLFTWKVLTDPAFVNAHFASLWRRLMRPRENPGLAVWFLLALRQLPELLVKRHRARRGVVLSDAEVIRPSGDPPGLRDARELPFGSLGTGRRVLVIGSAPLPFEGDGRSAGPCFRTWQVAQALLADEHDVTVVGRRVWRGYQQEETLPPALRFRGHHFTYCSLAASAFDAGDLLRWLWEQARPEVVVCVGARAAAAAARLDAEVPLWVDLSDMAALREQARAARDGVEAAAQEAREHERAALRRADVFSVATAAQKYALIGELTAEGALGAEIRGQDIVHCIPCSGERRARRRLDAVLRGGVAGEDDFVVLWPGRYDAATDFETLFEGVVAAMQEVPRLKLVSIGGPASPADVAAFEGLRRRVEESGLADHFAFVGWVPNALVASCQRESDVGLVVDDASYAALLSCRYRGIDMARAGLPLVVPQTGALGGVVGTEGIGLTFRPGDPMGLKEALVELARDPSLRRRCARRASEYGSEQPAAVDAMAPLRAWVRNPSVRAGRAARTADVLQRRARCALGRWADAWEAGGVRGALLEVGATLLGAAGGLALRMLVRRRGTAAWGLDPREPAERALVIRAGPLSLVREVVARLRARYPASEISVLAPVALADETEAAAGAPVIRARGVGAVSYRLDRSLLRALRGRRFDTVIVAGEGNRRAEMLALRCFGARRVGVRGDGAAHVFWWAPYKPLLLLVGSALSLLEKVVLSTCVGLVWGSVKAEGWLWRVRARHLAAPGPAGQ